MSISHLRPIPKFIQELETFQKAQTKSIEDWTNLQTTYNTLRLDFDPPSLKKIYCLMGILFAQMGTLTAWGGSSGKQS